MPLFVALLTLHSLPTQAATPDYDGLEQELEDGGFHREGRLSQCEAELTIQETLRGKLDLAIGHLLTAHTSPTLQQMLSLSEQAEPVRIALVGKDGSGKSTLIARFVEQDRSRLWIDYKAPRDSYLTTVIGRVQHAVDAATFWQKGRLLLSGLQVNLLRTNEQALFFRHLSAFNQILDLRIGVIGHDLLHGDALHREWGKKGGLAESSLSLITTGKDQPRGVLGRSEQVITMPIVQDSTTLFANALIEAGYPESERRELQHIAVSIRNHGLNLDEDRARGDLRSLFRLKEEWVRLVGSVSRVIPEPQSYSPSNTIAAGIRLFYQRDRNLSNNLKSIDRFLNTRHTPYGYIFLQQDSTGGLSRAGLIAQLRHVLMSRSSYTVPTRGRPVLKHLPLILTYRSGMDIEAEMIEAARNALLEGGYVSSLDEVPSTYRDLFEWQLHFSFRGVGVIPSFFVDLPPTLEGHISRDELITLIRQVERSRASYAKGTPFRVYLLVPASGAVTDLLRQTEREFGNWCIDTEKPHPTFRISGE